MIYYDITCYTRFQLCYTTLLCSMVVYHALLLSTMNYHRRRRCVSIVLVHCSNPCSPRNRMHVRTFILMCISVDLWQSGCMDDGCPDVGTCGWGRGNDSCMRHAHARKGTRLNGCILNAILLRKSLCVDVPVEGGQSR